jgi:DNA-binding XRE family transcriptional regulator
LACPSINQTLPIQGATNPINCRVLVVDINKKRDAESIDIDDFVADLEIDEGFKKETSLARKWLAEEVLVSDGLKEMRLKAGYSQMQLAKKINVHQPNLSAMEAGKRRPDYDIAKKLAVSLNVSVEEIYGTFEKNQG